VGLRGRTGGLKLARNPQEIRVGAIVRALVERLEAVGGDRIAVVGGVAANSELCAALPDAALAPLALCTDNAAMIASAARYTAPVPYPDYLSLDARATARLDPASRSCWGSPFSPSPSASRSRQAGATTRHARPRSAGGASSASRAAPSRRRSG